MNELDSDNLDSRKKWTGLVALIMTRQFIGAFCGLMISVTLARKLGSVNYGGWVFWNAIVLIPSLFYMGATSALERYLPEKETNSEKRKVFWGLAQFQLLLLVMAWGGILLFNETVFHWRPWETNRYIAGIDFYWVGLMALARHGLQVIGRLGAQCAMGYQQITLTQSTVAIKSILDLGVLLIVASMVSGKQQFLHCAMLGLLIVECGITGCWLVWLRQNLGGITQPSGALKSVLGKEIRCFSGPTIFISIMAAAKERLPILILGSQGQWTEGAGYSIIYRVCQFASKFYASICSTLLPVLVGTEKGELAQKTLSHWAPIYHGVVGISLFLSARWWLALWGVSISDEIEMLLLVYIAIFILIGAMRAVSLWADFLGDRKLIVKWAAVRGGVFIILICFLNNTPAEIATCELLALLAALVVALLIPTKIWPNKWLNIKVTLAFTIAYGWIYFTLR